VFNISTKDKNNFKKKRKTKKHFKMEKDKKHFKMEKDKKHFFIKQV